MIIDKAQGLLCCFQLSQDINCYLVDNNGFVVISKERSDVSNEASLVQSGGFELFTYWI